MADRRALVVGISGCSSSGKTTLARLLRDILPDTFILHEDDFYKPEDQLPSVNGLLDWDCAEALDVPSMASTLDYIRKHGSIPPTLDSKEDQNSVGKCPVPDSTIADLKSRVAASSLHADRPRLCIFDGFLLYPPSMAAVAPYIDFKLFLRASYARAKARREARDGYATIEGFWADPPGYVDKIVWPNYVREHAFMFKDGNVDGSFKGEVLQREGILAPPSQNVDADLSEVLSWMVDTILGRLSEQAQ